MGGKFAWVKPDVYPLIAAVVTGCSMGVYIMARKTFFDPSVDLSRDRRQEIVKPENAGYNDKAAAYKGSAVFQKIGQIATPHFHTEGEMLTQK